MSTPCQEKRGTQPAHLRPSARVNERRKHRPDVAEDAGGVDDEALPHHFRKQELVQLRPHLEQPHKRLRHLQVIVEKVC